MIRLTKLNLLPPAYYERRHKRGRMLRYATLAVVVAVAGVGWWRLADQQLQPLKAAVVVSERDLVAERARAAALAIPRGQFDRLAEVQALKGELQEPLPATMVVALISRLLPERAALSKLTVTMPPLTARTDNIAAGAAPDGAVLPAAKPPEAKPVRLELIGLAKSDGDVAQCISRLADHPLFSNVKLLKSKQLLDDGAQRVSFQITLEIPLNRKFTLPAKPAREGSANVN